MQQHGDGQVQAVPEQDRSGYDRDANQAVWGFDPTELALEASAALASDLEHVPDALCPEIGRRLLSAQLQFGRWVLRRVEKVEFERERSVSRKLTIEFLVPADAPTFRSAGRTYSLVPLSIMQRRTLVNLDLRDEHGSSVTVPGLRLNQQLDQSVLLAAAALTTPEAVLPNTRGRELIRDVVTGRKEEVEAAYTRFETPRRGDGLDALRTNGLFTETLYRVRHNFTLYLFLDAKQRHRLLRMSFEEPTPWRYDHAQLGRSSHAPRGLRGRAGDDDRAADEETEHVHRYQPGRRAGFLSGFRPAVGLAPTTIRFQVPSAERAASYHFEARAPLGLRIVRASLVAGRPNNPQRHVSADHWQGHSPTVGLHATEIPYGSLCRAQVELRVPSGGWLATLVASCWLTSVVLGSVLWHWLFGTARTWNATQITNICVLLISTAAGVAAAIAYREAGGLAARLLGKMRVLGLVEVLLPVVVAGFLVYSSGDELSDNQALGQRIASWGAFGVSVAITLLVTLVWWRSLRDEWVARIAGRLREEGDTRRARRRRRIADRVWPSPWDMTPLSGPASFEQQQIDQNFARALKIYGYGKPAIGIRSAEGWSEWYATTDGSHRADLAAVARREFRAPGGIRAFRCGDFATVCSRAARCPAD